MSRRGKSGASESSPKEKNSEDDTSKMNDSKTEWSEQERNRLLDALKSDEGKNNWRWIARQVKTRTTAQVKEFASKIRTEKQGSNKRAIAPKDDSPLEGWINATKRLRGDDNVDGTCIPQASSSYLELLQQNQASRAQQHTDSPRKEVDEACNKKMDQHHGSDDDKEEQQDSTADDISDQHQSAPLSGSNHNKDVQEPDSIMEDLLTNQKQMMAKISVLETKLEKLHSDRGNTKDADKQMIEKICVLDSKLEQLQVQSDDASSQSTVIELLVKINDKLDQLGKNASHSCCGGPVIIQTTPRTNVVHQPILDSCSSCRDSKKEKICERSTTVSSEDNTCTTLREKKIKFLHLLYM
ncbi:hypothetical protein OS493_028748 [Desmophyllum pertusum]|uniref:Uncharacterized protein n=1 Tax=Desmophyllum pertusum TaxID=174260 RepID=A0A9X0CDF8_9CNID|nr:hypothetical protein OS493_028748 [Desmophyllum pertusum]